MKKVILTGATGLIGKEAIQPLLDLGFEIYAISTKNQEHKDAKFTKANLFNYDEISKVFAEVKPEYLLHFAWVASGDYLISETNYKLVDASMNMLRAFKESGGKRAIFAGTCFEYKFKDEPLKEDDELDPQTIYAKCKNELREKAEIYCKENNIRFGWGRIFYVYGKAEDEKRLTTQIINNLRQNKEITVNNGDLIRDYMYTKDIASAFAKFLDTNVCGCVNICTGIGISIKEYASFIAKKMGKKNLLIIKNEYTNQPKIIVGDNSRLEINVKYLPRYNIKTTMEEVLKED